MIKEIEKQANEMLQIKENTARYREQVEKLENEIRQLEKEVAETLDFEKDVQLQDKKDRLPTFKQRLAQAERKEEDELKKRAMQLNNVVYRYQKKEMEQAEEIEEAYKTAKGALIDAYEAIQGYERAREKKAASIIEKVTQAGHDEAMRGVPIPHNNLLDSLLERAKTKINLNQYIGGGRPQSAKRFFEEITK